LSDYHYLLSGNYVLSHGSVNDTSIYGKDGVGLIIDKNITKIGWNNDFILAQQTKDNVINYWIIDIKTKSTYGPYINSNKLDFDNICKELGVDTKLKLENPEKYKYLDKSN
jgi:hypothetical protein